MKVPKQFQDLISKLNQAGYDGYFVGGCVRDLLLEKHPKDWDITTNARPEQIMKVFPDSKYENTFGTVLVKIKDQDDKTKEIVEITTYRSEQGYSDRRHPDKIVFEDSLDKDLSRRDFTVNAMAMNGKKELEDLFGGEKDLKKKIIRTVGEPADRFKEDALRMIRAIRFVCQLGFSLEEKTARGIVKLSGSIKFIAKERIKDELIKILESDQAEQGIRMLHRHKLLQYIIPELEQGIGMKQNHHHIYSVFDHSVLSLKHCPSKKWQVRFAALLHDIAKPKTMRTINGVATFYNHEYAGARMTQKIMERLRFSREDTENVVNLVKNHMFYYNVGEVTASSVRRLIAKVGEENLKDLIDLRIADRLGSGTPKAKPYKLRHLEYMMDKVRNDPVSVKMLKINGDDLIKILKIKPGPKIGAILDVLLSEVIEDPELNTKKHLSDRSKELDKLELSELREQAKEIIAEKQQEEDQQIKKEYHV
ncbi:MAG: CCA tRNA nucleotidyltransferase [bacterium]